MLEYNDNIKHEKLDYRRADSVQFRVRKHRTINKLNCISNIWGREIAEKCIRIELAK